MSSGHPDWDAGAEQHHANPFVLIHRSLRGKYPLVILLGLLFGLAGAAGGYLSRKPMYASTGIIRVLPKVEKILYETEQSRESRMFTSFVSTQAQFITSSNVIQSAMDSDQIQFLKDDRGIFFDDWDEIQDKIKARTNPRAQEIILVSYEDPDPFVSQAIVDSVLESYIMLYGTEGSIRDPGRLSVLKDEQRTLVNSIDRINGSIEDIVEAYNTENLSPLVDEMAAQVRATQAQLDQVNRYLEDRAREMKLVETGGVPQGETDPETTQSEEDVAGEGGAEGREGSGGGELGESESETALTEEEVASIDARMRTLIAQRDTLEENRRELMAAGGLREEHRDVRSVTMMIQNVQGLIDERLEQFRTGVDLELFDEEDNPIPSESELLKRRAELDNILSEEKKVAQQLLNDSRDLNGLREEKTQKMATLAQIEQRLIMIETETRPESGLDGRISIAQEATMASSPTSDPRKKMAAAGFVGLGSLPVLAILVLGHLSHRVNYSDDEVLSGANAGIVGMLPDLGNSLEDQELAAASAFAVHQLRSQLQIKGGDTQTQVYGVTSPAPGEGKTSLIIAMGLSFAESGSRTLLLDLDFIGRGLSIHFGHARAPSLADRLAEADEVAQLIHETEFPGLSILPAGYADDLRVSKLSPRSLETLLAPLRERFDTILIDSGPILGSVEAAFISPQADGVLLVVGRGQYKPLIKKAINQIHAVDGTIAATIFNRASMNEIRHSSCSMSVHFSRQFSRLQQGPEGVGAGRGGPLAGTMFSGKRSGGRAARGGES